MPCGQFAANAMFFRIGAMAYNLFIMFKAHVLPDAWGKYQVQTVRWRLYQIPARITRHARSLWMNVSNTYIALFRDIRLRCHQNTRVWAVEGKKRRIIASKIPKRTKNSDILKAMSDFGIKLCYNPPHLALKGLCIETIT